MVMPDFVDADGLSSQEEEWRRGINLPAPGTVEFQSLPTVIQIAARFPLLRIDSPPPVLAGSSGSVSVKPQPVSDDKAYVVKLFRGKKLTLSASDKLYVTKAASYAFPLGTAYTDPPVGEVAFPNGGSITMNVGGHIHVNGSPKLALLVGCTITVPRDMDITVTFLAEGDVISGADYGELGDWEDIIHQINAPTTDRELVLPACDGLGKLRHTVGLAGAEGDPYTITLGDGTLITAPSAKSVYIVGARSRSYGVFAPDDCTGLRDDYCEFSYGGSIIVDKGGLVCIPGSMVLKLNKCCLVDIPIRGTAKLRCNVDDIEPSHLDMHSAYSAPALSDTEDYEGVESSDSDDDEGVESSDSEDDEGVESPQSVLEKDDTENDEHTD
ncbi:hypothetical protein Bca4012_041211 [Brassica carinata]